MICFHFGRLLSYAAIGLLVGMLVSQVDGITDIGPWLRVVAGVLLILMGFYLAGIWRGLSYLEKLMQPVWRPISLWLKRYIPFKNPADAAIVGLFWGWLPCGLVYSSLAWASTISETGIESAVLMFTMGIGTLPALIGISFFSQFLRKKWSGILTGIALCLFGVWTITMPLMMLYPASGSESDAPSIHHIH